MRLLPSEKGQGAKTNRVWGVCRQGCLQAQPGGLCTNMHSPNAAYPSKHPEPLLVAPVSARTRVVARLLVWAENFWKRIASLGAVLTNSATPQTRTHRPRPVLTHWLGGCCATLPPLLLKVLLRAVGAVREAMLRKAVVELCKPV